MQEFCDFKSDDFKRRNLVLKKYKVDITKLPEEILELLFYKTYQEEDLWYLLSTVHANSFEVEDVHAFLCDVEFDTDCCDVLDGYFNSDPFYIDQIAASAYFDFKTNKWTNEELDLTALPGLQRSESVSQLKCQETQEKQLCEEHISKSSD